MCREVISFNWCLCFFKQKPAYEMRISDWSSDVCSSDLLQRRVFHLAPDQQRGEHRCDQPAAMLRAAAGEVAPDLAPALGAVGIAQAQHHRGPVAHRAKGGAHRDIDLCPQDEGVDAGDPHHSQPCGKGTRSTSRSEEHTSELPSLMRTSYAAF